jgi:hypothetical protein
MDSISLAFVLLQVPAEAAELGMGPFAWSFMLISMGAVTLLTAWCFTRVMRTRRHFDPDGTGPAVPPVPGDAEQPRDVR